MGARILNVTSDCGDARAQAAFWAAVTGWTATEQESTPGHVENSADPPDGTFPGLYFTTVPDTTT
jgi:hypothetical protein